MVSDTIYVGSLNPVKINAALNTLSDTLEHDFDAQGMAVPSGSTTAKMKSLEKMEWRRRVELRMQT